MGVAAMSKSASRGRADAATNDLARACSLRDYTNVWCTPYTCSVDRSAQTQRICFPQQRSKAFPYFEQMRCERAFESALRTRERWSP